jgi:lipopolysaccharide transport system permease protein
MDGRGLLEATTRLAQIVLYADVYRYSELFRNLFRREVNARYRGSWLGVGWTLVNPLVLVGVYTLVFSVLWRAQGIAHYPLFIVSGLAVWIFFQSSVQMASGSLIAQTQLVKQVRFPRQLIPLAVVGSNLVVYIVMLLVIVPLNLVFVPGTRETIWAVIPLSLPLIALTTGLSLVSSALSALYRDVEHLLAALFLPWFFLTPVFYELGTLPGVKDHPHVIDVLHWVNVVTPIVESIRAPLFYGEYAGVSDVAYAVLVGLGALALGAFVFRRVDDQLAVRL